MTDAYARQRYGSFSRLADNSCAGLKRGALTPNVNIAAGDSYTITASGTVFSNPADGFIQSVVGIGSGEFPFTTNGSNDRLEVFATPHPWFRDLSGTVTSPISPDPAPTASPSPAPADPAPVAQRVTAHCLSLPVHQHLTDDEVDQVIDGVRAAVS